MLTTSGHLTYCTNVKAGDIWYQHIAAVKKYSPFIKQKLSLDKPMDIGLHLSKEASIELAKKQNLSDFKTFI